MLLFDPRDCLREKVCLRCGRAVRPRQSDLISGNPAGRPLGSKNRVAEDFVKALADDFAEHGKAVIEKVRLEKPGTYLKLVADLVPKDFNVGVTQRYVARLPEVCATTEEWLDHLPPKNN